MRQSDDHSQSLRTGSMKKPFHPALVRIAFFVVGVGPVSSRAWYEPGHRIINQLAIDSLPAGFPSWVREPAVQERIVFLSQVPGRSRGGGELLLPPAQESR